MDTKTFNRKDWKKVGAVATKKKGHLRIGLGDVGLPGFQVSFLDTDAAAPIVGKFGCPG
jgi:hypothetical protein